MAGLSRAYNGHKWFLLVRISRLKCNLNSYHANYRHNDELRPQLNHKHDTRFQAHCQEYEIGRVTYWPKTRLISVYLAVTHAYRHYYHLLLLIPRLLLTFVHLYLLVVVGLAL